MIYLVRHGETEWNKLRRLQGHTDIQLNTAGEEMITEAGKQLKSIGFRVDHIACSPLKRAAQTARILAQQLGYTGEIVEDDDLKERCFGSAEGLSLLEPLCVDDPKYGAETREALGLRVAAVLERYRAKAQEDWLLVTHGGFIKETLSFLMQANGQQSYTILAAHGNPIRLEEENGLVTVRYVLPTKEQW